MTTEHTEIEELLAADPNFEPEPERELDEGVVEVTIPGKILTPKEVDDGSQ